ncbi:glycerophosphodiester phosphodiesterase [Pseudorhodoplanes sinuspersici]|uniref:Glycerophosphodiester phosphodiesterase n=1 Tax=Pseudorhodoplanes sinuspersici TaxID=1235591 RepID=A0A1W6ZMP5_9HYPH|nr:glycerophosphodiester phosphodiesterase [Pseudorhodoplanes sinuspersici]ARP98400.1 glycerophosphodiester phosphodiesterase [Pseudorhodoplanes sinuspersici]RKE66067.1 glycerophosphoryl diester phosphodiesterase [Pseudorhodoplanes sinuspersici]
MRRLVAASLLAAFPLAALAFDLQGHRGARGLAPENTIPAFERALQIGVSTLELDLAVTKDNVLVVSHDAALDPDITRGPDGKFLEGKTPAIRSLTFAELERYDVGRIRPDSAYAARFRDQRGADNVRIPALTEVFDLVKRTGADHIRFNIETKIEPESGGTVPDPESFAALFAKAVRDAGLTSRVTVQSFDWRTLVAMKQIAPDIERSCLTIEDSMENNIQRGKPGPSPWTAGFDIDDVGGSVPRLVKTAGCSTWSPYFHDITAALVKEAQALGLKVIPWTVNEMDDLTLVIETGVDGLITDYPDRGRAALPKTITPPKRIMVE